jgi:lactate dehydrogenase-like 2-hydroxyacid dehydrogenase
MILNKHPLLLMLNGFSPYIDRLLGDRFRVEHLYEAPDRARLLADIGPGTRFVAAGASVGFPSDLWTALPTLEVIAIHGVGTDKVDLEEARRRGVTVFTTPDILSEDVADLAIGMWIALSRRITEADRYVREGRWRAAPFALARRVSDQRVGILGLGRIGRAIARRAEPFAASIAYTSRRPVSGAPYLHEPDAAKLADRSDVLFVALPGGEATHGAVGAEVLAALGPAGMLVNIARGSVVDEAALLAALRAGHLGGAALDVFRNEPDIDPAFAELENVLLQPHLGSATVETRYKMAQHMAEQLRAYSSGTEKNA